MIAAAVLALCLGQSPCMAEPSPKFGQHRTFYLGAVMVDGLPVYKTEEMLWDGCDWIYAESDQGRDVENGIHPKCMERME